MGRWAAIGLLAPVAALSGEVSVATAVSSSSMPAGTSGRGACKDTNLRPTRKDISRVTVATLCLIDRERAVYGLGALRSNSSLQHIAASQAKAMVVGNYFGDDTPGGATPWQRIAASPYGIDAHSVAAAQNIGWGTERMATPAAMVSIWMHSAPHRQIVLTGGYRDIGIGVAPAAPARLTRGAPGATYTVEFAVRG